MAKNNQARQRINEARRKREQQQMAEAAVAAEAAQDVKVEPVPTVKTSPETQNIFNMMEGMGLDQPENQQAVLNMQKLYNRNENQYFFTTMMLFAKKHLLTDESFHFLKTSMNVMKHVYNLMHALSGVGLLNQKNLDSFISLPALTELNALFDLIGAEDEETLDQTKFDHVVSTAKPITESLTEEIKKHDDSSHLADALINCAKNQICSEALLQKVKAHPYPQRIASTLIDLKQRGVQISNESLDAIFESNTPKAITETLAKIEGIEQPDQMIDALVSGAKAVATSEVLSPVIGKVANYAYQGFSSLCSSFFSSEPAAPAKAGPEPDIKLQDALNAGIDPQEKAELEAELDSLSPEPFGALYSESDSDDGSEYSDLEVRHHESSSLSL